MNQRIPFFMPMYPGSFEQELNNIRNKLNELENRIENIENPKIIKLNDNESKKETFKEGYML